MTLVMCSDHCPNLDYNFDETNIPAAFIIVLLVLSSAKVVSNTMDTSSIFDQLDPSLPLSLNYL